jgi:N-acetyl-alpha-D-muramate 1-phosphate uridylyltransferase
MILAAGRGERMRPLTDSKPKPLLMAGGRMLIEHQIIHLAQAGFTDIVINHAYLGEMIEHALGDGQRYGVHIQFSPEHDVLETAGGIANALPLLTDIDPDKPFLVTNADVYCEFDYARLLPVLQRDDVGRLAHLVLVNNPAHHATGDFALNDGIVELAGEKQLTFSGIGVYRPVLFSGVTPRQPAKLAPVLRAAIAERKVTGEYFSGIWEDIGTPERLQQLDRQLIGRYG